MKNNSQVKIPRNSKYLIALVVVITAIGINYFYSMSMAFITTFILAYISKGSRSR